MVVGNYFDKKGIARNSRPSEPGNSWRLAVMPGGCCGLDETTSLTDVCCGRATSRMAVGNYLDADQLGHNLAVRWNGRTWRPTRTSGAGGGLSGVSYRRPASAIAVGPAGGLALAERWNSTTWRRLTTANP